jgi:hypothetical protein
MATDQSRIEGSEQLLGNRGVIATVRNRELISPVTEANKTIATSGVVVACAESHKINLGEEIAHARGTFGALVAHGGQDAAGEALYTGGRVEAVLVVADGCSFGERTQTSKAAQLVVSTTLESTTNLAKAKNASKETITAAGGEILHAAHRKIKADFPDGAATAMVAIVSEEAGEGGARQIYLHTAHTGDAQVIILAQHSQSGETRLEKINLPEDALDQMMMKQGVDLDNMPLWSAQQTREEQIRLMSDNAGITLEQARRVLTESGIYSYLGGTGDHAPNITSERANLSQDFFAHGWTNLKVIACSDNAGDKVSEDVLKTLYAQHSSDNYSFGKALGEYMVSQDLDDGCLAMVSVGRLPST